MSIADNKVNIRIQVDNAAANQSLASTSIAVDSLGGSVKDMAIGMGAGTLAVDALRGALAKVAEGAKALLAARVAADQLRQSMAAVFGDQSIASMAFSRQIADRLGASVMDVSRAYASFAASTNGTALAGEKTRAVFEAIASAAGKMGLSSEQSNRAFLALSQMAAKGVVSMEELRGQLSEAMPGAMQAAARAMGVTVAELGKMAESGALLADDMLPKLAEEFNRTFGAGGAVHTAGAEIERLANAWLAMKQSLADTGAADIGIGVIEGLTIALKDATAAMDEARRRGWGATGQVLGGVGAFLFGGTTIEDQRREIKTAILDVERMIDALQSKAKRNDGWLPLMDRGTLTALKRDLAGLEGDLRNLTVTTGKIALPDLAGQAKKQEAALESTATAALKAWASSGKFATKAEQTQQKLAEMAQAYARTYQAALDGGVDGGALDKIVADYVARAAELQKVGADRTAQVESEAAAYKAVQQEALAAMGAGLSAADVMRQLHAEDAAAAASAVAAAKAREQSIQAMAKEAESLEQQVVRAREENEAIGLTTGQLSALRLARFDAAIAAKEQALATMEAGDAAAAEVQALLHQIDALRELRGLSASSAVNQENVRAVHEQEQAWENFARDIERSLTDSLYRSFEAGEDFGKTFVKSLQNTLKSTVLKVAVQAIVSPVTSAMGLGGSSGGNAVGSASSLWNAYSGGTTAAWSSFATSGIGEAIGLSSATSLGTSSIVMESALSQSIGAALPWVGGALALASLFGAFDSGGGPKTEGGLVQTIGGGTAELSSTGQKFFTGNSADEAIAAILDPLATSIDEWARKLGGDASGLEIGLGFNSDPAGTSGDSVGGGVYRNGEELYFRAFGGYAQGSYQQELAAETNRILLAAMESLDLNDLADSYLDGLDIAGLSADAAAQAVGFLQATQQLVDAFGVLGIGADAVTTELLAMMGGVDAAVASLNAYYETYYSEADRNGILTEQLAGKFADLNLAMPETKDEFRSLVESLDLTATGGQEAYAALMGMAPAFATVADAAEATADAMVQAATDAAEATARAAEQARTAMQSLYDDLIGGLRAGVESAWSGVEASFGQAMEDRTAEYDAAIATLEAAAKAAQAEYDAVSTRAENERKAAQAVYETQIAAIDAAARAIDARIEAERTRYDTDRGALKTLIDDLTDPIKEAGDAVSRMERLTGSLADTLDGLRIQGSEREYRSDAQAQIRNALAVARTTGVLPDADALQSALQTISQPSQDLFSTFEDYARDFYRTAIDIRDLNDLSQGALDTARSEYDVLVSLETSYQQQLDAMETAHDTAMEALDLQREAIDLQREQLAQVRDDRINAADAALENARIEYDRIIASLDAERASLTDAYEMDMQVFEDQLSVQRNIYEAALGIDSSVMSVQDAIAALATAVNALSLQPGTPNVPTSVAPVYDQWQTSGNVQAFASSTGAGAVQAIGNTDPTGIVWTDATGQNSATQAVLTQAANDLLNAGQYDELLSRADTLGLSNAALSQISGVATETIDAWRQEMVTLTNGWSGTKAELRDAVMAEYAAGRMTETDLYLGARDLGLTSSLLDEIMEWPIGTTAGYGALHNLPAFAAGTNYVPADMLAQVHAGERIIPAADNAALWPVIVTPDPGFIVR